MIKRETRFQVVSLKRRDPEAESLFKSNNKVKKSKWNSLSSQAIRKAILSIFYLKIIKGKVNSINLKLLELLEFNLAERFL